MKRLFLLLLVLPVLITCSLDDSQPNVDTSITFEFTHQWGDQTFTFNDLGITTLINENDDELIIERLRYLISNIRLYNENGNTMLLQGYSLVELNNNSSLSFTVKDYIPKGNYSKISFTFGFSPQNNKSGEYPDLNSAGWNWPEDLGGGYHFLQMDGTFTTLGGQEPFNFHMGTARNSIGVFESNHVNIILDQAFTIDELNTIKIRMDISEWFKNPNTWDLNEYNTDLMGNYDAQKMMNENAGSVFSLGPVTSP